MALQSLVRCTSQLHTRAKIYRHGLMFNLRCLGSTTNPAVNNNSINYGELKPFDDIPGPLSLPKIGCLPYILKRSLGKKFTKAMLELPFELVKDFGRIHKISVPGFTSPIVQIAVPEEIIKVFHPEPKYPKRIDMPIISTFMEENNKIKGVFFGDGEDWYRHRSVISKRMLKPKDVSDYSHNVNEVITDFMTRFETVIEQQGTEHEHEVKGLDQELFKWAFESISYILLEKRFGCLNDDMVINEDVLRFIAAVNGWLNTSFPVSLLPISLYKYYKTKDYTKFIFCFKEMYKYAEMFIDMRVEELKNQGKLDPTKESGSQVGLFEFLVANGKLSRDDIVASVIDLIFAGVETTSNTILWSLYMLGKNQEKQQTLFEEVTSVLKPGEIPSVEAINKMPYLKAWIRETLRLYPVLQSIIRHLTSDIELCGYHIPAGNHVQILSYYLCRDESIFQNANQFQPERWLRDADNHLQGVPHVFASIPFGFGKRMCVGRRIAELEMHTLMARIVQEYKVLYPHSYDVEPETRGTVVPDRDVRVKFMKRA